MAAREALNKSIENRTALPRVDLSTRIEEAMKDTPLDLTIQQVWRQKW